MIEEPSSGQKTNTLWRVVAKCARALNAWSTATVSPQGAGKFTVSDSNVVLELNTIQATVCVNGAAQEVTLVVVK